MRLAYINMRLLVFFAGVLRKWVRSIEPTPGEHLRPESPVDHGDVDLTESRTEAGVAFGPPEHWMRVVRTAPPDHWLDLIREQAPHLLSVYENDSAATSDEAVQEGTLGEHSRAPVDPETVARRSEDETSSLAPKPAARRPERPADSTSRISGATWLSRVRFERPKDRAATENIQQRQYPLAEVSRAAGESPLTPPSDYVQGREITERPFGQSNDQTTTSTQGARRAPDSVNEGSDYFESGRATGELRRQDFVSRQENWSDYVDRHTDRTHELTRRLAARDATPEQPSGESDDNMRPQREANVFSNVVVARSDTNAAGVRSLSRTNSSDEPARGDDGKRAEKSKASADELDHSRGLRFVEGAHVLSPAAERFDHHPPETKQGMAVDHERRSTNQRRATAQRSRGTEKAIAADKPVAHQSQADSAKKARIDFVTPDGEQAVDQAWPEPVQSVESMWPTLPLSPAFEVVDELAAMEREAEALRRLDREQRGTLWNV